MPKSRTSKHRIESMLERISVRENIRLMEVCGTHTMAIARFGLKQLLPASIQLISGPGCPVCVTAQEDIERVLILAQNPRVLITTFGDMVRVPGSTGSLQEMAAQGANVRIIYSPLDAIALAQNNPNKEVVFLAVGFETTAPTVAMALEQAQKLGLENFSIVCLHKLVIPALIALLEDPEIQVQGFLCPGHVSTIIGTYPYEFIPKKYACGCVVSGFEPEDILESITLLVEQIKNNNFQVQNQYVRAVKPEGNKVALSLIEKYFEPTSVYWRGLGKIPQSGLKLKAPYVKFDALRKFNLVDVEVKVGPTGCQCGQILKGIKKPDDCPLFATICTPSSPVGPCMVSSEGACAASYYYRGGEVIAR
ncbi:MAG: hydrogenase formation protein HypD [Clostridia bacterium]|nr:hydrogenase formation protein HypD [Clostridia bacterium]